MDPKCKICRRLGTKLFLKGDKCYTPKCPLTLKPYPPGKKRRRRASSLSGSEYARELKEKQKLRYWYGLREKQFRNSVKKAMRKVSFKGESGKEANAGDVLVSLLENRFDNIIFRLGLASSRAQARQLISHGHFLINNRPVNISSFKLKKGDKIKVKPESVQNKFFQKRSFTMKKYKPPHWLKLDADKWEGEIIGQPTLEEVSPPADILSIFEFYSR